MRANLGYTFSIVAILISMFCFGQQGELKNAVLDFTVPDNPAFNVLGTTPTNMLRPSNPQELVVSISQFVDGKKFVLPKSIGIETSPYLLFTKGKLVNLNDYKKNYWAKTMSLSFGSSRLDSNQSTTISFGLRFNVFKDGEELFDSVFVAQLRKILRKDNNRRAQLETAILLIKPFDDVSKARVMGRLIDSLLFYYFSGANQSAKTLEVIVNNVEKDLMNTASLGSLKGVLEEFSMEMYDPDAALKDLKKKFKEEHWNDRRLEIAAAALGSSLDSTGKNLQFSRVSVWITGSPKIDNWKWGQLILGGNIAATKEYETQKWNGTISFNARVYGGNNDYKGLLETQHVLTLRADNTYGYSTLLNAGAEINLINLVWLSFQGGINTNDLINTNRAASPYFSFDWRFSIPDDFLSLFQKKKANPSNSANY